MISLWLTNLPFKEKKMTQFQEYCENNKYDLKAHFTVIDHEDGLVPGDIVKLTNDDDSDCPTFKIVSTGSRSMSVGDEMYVYYENLTQSTNKEKDPNWSLSVADKLREEAKAKVQEYNEYLASRPSDDHKVMVLR